MDVVLKVGHEIWWNLLCIVQSFVGNNMKEMKLSKYTIMVVLRGHLQRSFIEIHILSTKLWALGIYFHPLPNKKWCAEVKYSETVCILNLNS